MKSYFDIVGDGGSDVMGQVAERQSQIARRLAGVRHRLAIASGKGGVGKSTLTMQLALALVGLGRRVAVLDADLNGPSQARMAGLRPSPPVPGPDGLTLPRGRSGISVLSMGSLVPEGQALEFESVAEGASHSWRALREFTTLEELLAATAFGELDVLLIDLPPGAERTFQYAEFFGPETAFVLVTVPSAVARGVVARSAAALIAARSRVLGVIENMQGYACAGCEQVRPLFRDAAEVDLGVPSLGRVPFDPALAEMCDSGEAPPATGAGPAVDAIRGIAARILATLEEPS